VTQSLYRNCLVVIRRPHPLTPPHQGIGADDDSSSSHGARRDGFQLGPGLQPLLERGAGHKRVRRGLRSMIIAPDESFWPRTQGGVDAQARSVVLVGHSYAERWVITEAANDQPQVTLVYVLRSCRNSGRIDQALGPRASRAAWVTRSWSTAVASPVLAAQGSCSDFAQNVTLPDGELLPARKARSRCAASTDRIARAAWHTKPNLVPCA